VGEISEKAVCRSVFLIIWHCILSAELTKMHYFGDFAHWDSDSILTIIIQYLAYNLQSTMSFEHF